MPNNQQTPQDEPRRAQPGHENPDRRQGQDMEREGGMERNRERERQDQQKRPQ